MDPWWTQQQAGLIGGVFGATIGICGGLVGTFGGIFAPQGRLRPLVLGMVYSAIGLGALGLVVGLAALVVRQPIWVCYPLLLTGLIAVASFGSALGIFRRRYHEAEMRRLAAEEFRRSG